MRHTFIALALGGCLAAACAVSQNQPPPSSDGGPQSPLDQEAGSEAAAPDAGDPTHGSFCGQPGRSCSASSDCCSGECVSLGDGGVCYDPPTACTANGGGCVTDDACCSLTCTNGKCATGCAELWTDCSVTSCCTGSCKDNVCQILNPVCGDVGATCTGDSNCCSGVCTNGACAEKACVERGDACAKPEDCCTGACSEGSCVDKPQCAWTGGCAANYECCTGVCNLNGAKGTCAPPVEDTVCRFLEKGVDNDFADCFDCISTSCCDAEYASLDWTQCFQGCMSSLDTWDSWATCESTCNSKVGPAPDSLTTCVQTSCGAACKVQP